MPGEYAPDESTAEKAHGHPAGHANGQTGPLSNIEGSPNGDLQAAGEHNAIEELDFRPDAKVWHLYLVEAEREAKERAELWRTGLDAVLIFAGLFAGIVSAFVIDVRKDLEADSEQRLLTSIELILSQQQPLPKRIPAISIAMSGLWNISLYITLFAAMMGASAKAWLATFVSVNTPHEAKGAFHRYRLDQHAERWCLREVIASAPLLVQLALGLFLVGLLLQNFIDNWILGVLLLLFFVSGGILYLLLTIHPWGTPSSPYNTAISDPLMWVALGLPSRGKKDPPDVEMDINKGLADILYTRLLKSPNPAFVDEAIAEVALPGFKQKWVNYLCRNDTPLVILRHLRQHVAVRPTASDRNSNSFCNILLVLLRFLEHYEVETMSLLAGDRQHTGGDFKMFTGALYQLSPSDNPLALLHDISEDVDVLLLSLCIHLDCRNPRLRPPEYSDWRHLPRWRGLRLDTTATNDWANDVTHLKLAACRAIVTGNDQHKVLSTRLLVSRLVSATTHAWRGDDRYLGAQRYTSGDDSIQQACFSVGLKCLGKLYNSVVSEWKEGLPHTPYTGNTSRPGASRRYNRRKASRSASLSVSTGALSESMVSTISTLVEEEENSEIGSLLQQVAKGQTSDAPKAVVQSAFRSLCAAILDSDPEDRSAIINTLALFNSKYSGQFGGLEDLVSSIHDILPLILHELPQGVAAESAEDQDRVLMLLSSIARVPEVRRDIVLHILNIATKSAAQHILERNVELLVRLLMDERLAHEPTDFVMLTFASQLALDIPRLGSYHARTLEALRSKYESKAFELDAIKHKELLNWFLLAVLGQRATTQEVSNWVSRCQLWFTEGQGGE